MIRKLVYEDKEQYLELVHMFIDERMGGFGLKYDEQNAKIQFDLFFRMPETVAIVSEMDGKLVGTIAGVTGKILFCEGLMLQEMVWYVRPEYRSHRTGFYLIREFERMAKDLGCSRVMMIGMESDPVEKFYLRDGYKLLQNYYHKELA